MVSIQEWFVITYTIITHSWILTINQSWIFKTFYYINGLHKKRVQKIQVAAYNQTSEPPKYSNSPNLLLCFFCLIKSRANSSGFTQPFLNPNLIFFSNTPQIVCCRINKKIKTKIWRIRICIFWRFRCRE